jgi:hypothetical protein
MFVDKMTGRRICSPRQDRLRKLVSPLPAVSCATKQVVLRSSHNGSADAASQQKSAEDDSSQFS